MPENNRKKPCEACDWKEESGCSECVLSDGGADGRERSQEAASDDRRRRWAEREAQAARVAQQAPLLGRWLWVLFWLLIPRLLGSALSSDSIAEWAPGLALSGRILILCISAAEALILLKMGAVVRHYRTAASFELVALAAAWMPVGNSMPWSVILVLCAFISGLLGRSLEATGHADALSRVDAALSGKWRRLRNWIVWASAGLAACSLLLPVILAIGEGVLPIIFIVGVVLVVVGIVLVVMELVYLYRTAKCFRAYGKR